jgi:ArsR family transcriptional regulator
LKHAEELKKVAEKGMTIEYAEQKAKVFKALSDNIRLRILSLLEKREVCVCEVLVSLGLTQPTASHHLGILENTGLVKKRKEGKWVFYRVADAELLEHMRRIHLL